MASETNQTRALASKENSYYTNSIDVSFSIPDWKQKQIQSINEQYEKEIFTAVPLSLTDFDSKEEIEFLTPPERCSDENFAYQRKLHHPEDFSILAFIMCLEQLLIGDPQSQTERLDKFKKKISTIDLCCLSNIPQKMKNFYDNKVLKKILFQYINKGSYNVSLLEVLLRRNSVLKFSLSLVSKSIMKKRGIIHAYNEKVPIFVEMRTCGDEFEVLSTIKVRQKFVETENFYIKLDDNVEIFRKQNIIKKRIEGDRKDLRKRSLSPGSKISEGNERRSKQQKSSQYNQAKSEKDRKNTRRSNSLVNFFRKLICY